MLLNALLYEFNALLYEFNALLYEFNALLYEFNTLLYEFNALLYEFNALLYEFKALLYEFNALLYEFNALLYEFLPECRLTMSSYAWIRGNAGEEGHSDADGRRLLPPPDMPAKDSSDTSRRKGRRRDARRHTLQNGLDFAAVSCFFVRV